MSIIDLTTQVQRLYDAVIQTAPDLRGRLQALAWLGLAEASATVETVRGMLFRVHGWQ
jgi:hypothetical protein